MDILTASPQHTTTTSKQVDTPATAPPSDMSTNTNDDASENDEYETAFDKLQKIQNRLANPDVDTIDTDMQNVSAKKRRGKSNTYGVSSLEVLEDNEPVVALDIDAFARDDTGNRKSMFDDLSTGSLSEGDESGYVSDVSEKSAGRLKGRRKKSTMHEDDDESVVGRAWEEAGGESGDEGEMEFDETEASGYGFSQGVVRSDEADDLVQESEAAKSETEGPHVMNEDVEPGALDAAVEEEQIQSEESLGTPTEADLYTVVDSIFEAADKNTMTVKQVNKSVADHFKMDKVDKEMKALIKERLTKLVSGEIKIAAAVKEKKSKKEKKAKKEKKEAATEPEEDFVGDVKSEEEVNYDSSSDYDEAPAKKSTKKTRKPKQSDDASLSDDSIASDKPRKSRRRRRSSGKMAKHLRDHAIKLRKRQLEESRIRQEEMGNIAAKAEEGPKLSEEDRARAQAIAARFDTNREEELVKREEDRAGLIDVLRKKRLKIITMEDDEKVEDVVESKEGVKSEVMIDLDDDEEESSEEEDESEPVAPVATAPPKKLSAMDCLMAKPGDISAPIVSAAKPKHAANSRLALRNALRAKQVKAGNRWLARELGYKTEEDHIKECMDVEMKKRRQILFLEQQAALGVKKELGASNPAFDVPSENDAASVAGDEEEDEELAMAKQMEDSEVKSDAGDDVADDEVMFDEESGFGNEEAIQKDEPPAHESSEEFGEPKPQAETSTPASSPAKTITSVVSPSGSSGVSHEVSTESTEASMNSTEKTVEAQVSVNADQAQSERDTIQAEVVFENNSNAEQNEIEATKAVETDTEEAAGKPNKPKNSAWKEMLRKEKEMLARQKKIHKKGGGLVEGEAEEEEEDEGIVGLEDFGFSVEKKKDDDADEDDAEADEDDLEHVVDDLSDGEGDEEAGDKARKQLEAREEKERHKEIMRRMREGYDGRRGGIASGGARGVHRFDQLVAADNREDAKRLGLLNEDEMDSDDENENGEPKAKKDSEDDDEAALLDKLLKERFLNRDEEDVFEENFSDSEEEDADEEQANGENPQDDEEKEQERMAKQFAKRARMNRILEAYEGDTEFSRSRLIDEDASMQIELKTMKTTQAKKRASIYSESSNFCSTLFKRQKSDSNIGSQPSKEEANLSTFTSREGSLSLALMASRNATSRKRKTTFLSGKQSNTFSRQNSSSNKSISLSHVVFVTGESQSASQFSSSASNLGKSNNKKSTSKFTATSSLWSRAVSKNWSK